MRLLSGVAVGMSERPSEGPGLRCMSARPRLRAAGQARRPRRPALLGADTQVRARELPAGTHRKRVSARAALGRNRDRMIEGEGPIARPRGDGGFHLFSWYAAPR